MKKLIPILIPLLLLLSCTLVPEPDLDLQMGGERAIYYKSLKDECDVLSDMEKGGCHASIKWMEKNNFVQVNGKCPEDMQEHMNKTRGSKRWCEPKKNEDQKNICPPGMYLSGAKDCSPNTSCPSGQTLTGFAGTQFCMLAPEDQTSSSDMTLSGKTDMQMSPAESIRAIEIRNIIKNNTEFSGRHNPMPSRIYTMKTQTALMQAVTREDIPVLRILLSDRDNLVRIGAEHALGELTASGAQPTDI